MPTSTQKLSRAGCRMFSIFPPSRPAYGRILALDPPLPVSSAPRIVLRHASLYLVVFSVLSMLADMAVFLLGLSVAAVASRRVASARARDQRSPAFACTHPPRLSLVACPPCLGLAAPRRSPALHHRKALSGTAVVCGLFPSEEKNRAFPTREGEPKEKRRGGPRPH